VSDTGQVRVPPARLARWVQNFGERHDGAILAVASGALTGVAGDGSTFAARLPFDTSYDGPAEVGAFVAAASPPGEWGVLLVRKGGFAVARLAGERLVESKVGQRHVQGRTKAGGQSQQRFARRREGQVRVALGAAADNVVRILVPEAARLDAVVLGGDRTAVDEVLTDRRLEPLLPLVTGRLLDVPDPRRTVLEGTPDLFRAVRIRLLDPA
jgi:hypothetical protein